MIVAELIKELQKRPADAKVIILDRDGRGIEAARVSPPYQDNPFRQSSEWFVDIT